MTNFSPLPTAVNTSAPKRSQKKPYRRHQRRMDDHDPNTGGTWLISFTDVMGLMLTFFVMMYAMSSPLETKWQEMSESVKENFNRFYGQKEFLGTQEGQSIDRIRLSRGLDQEYLKALLETQIAQDKSLKGVSVLSVEQGVILSFPDDLLFESGTADLTPQGARAVYTVGAALERVQNRVEILGHTDPRPITGGVYLNNWDLSLDRALKVADVLKSAGYEKQLSLRGHAFARYDELDPAIEESKRLGLSRRVDIMIMEDRGERTKALDIIVP